MHGKGRLTWKTEDFSLNAGGPEPHESLLQSKRCGSARKHVGSLKLGELSRLPKAGRGSSHTNCLLGKLPEHKVRRSNAKP